MLISKLVNLFCVFGLQDNKKIKSDSYSDILKIMNHYKVNIESVPIDLRLKVSLIEKIIESRLAGNNKDTTLINIKTTEKFVSLTEYLNSMESTVIDDSHIDSYVNQIKMYKKYVISVGDYRIIRDFFNKAEQNEFGSVSEMVTDYEKILSSLHNNYNREKIFENIASLNSLDLFSDDYDYALDQIEKNYNRENHISTGYPSLDKYMYGGFEPGRIYIFAGTSGDGKSTLIVNMLKNQLNKKIDTDEKEDLDIHVYITLENLIDESLLRFYCCSESVKKDDVLDRWKEHKPKIRKTLIEKQANSKSVIVAKYYPATSISVPELMDILFEIKEQYNGKGTIKSIWIDYLDLLKSDRQYDAYRMELGQITIDMKVMAIMLNVPVITVTQLNRGALLEENPSLANMGESMKKVEHADLVALIKHALDEKEDGSESEEGTMKVCIAKNRNGKKNVVVKLRTRLDKFEIKASLGEGPDDNLKMGSIINDEPIKTTSTSDMLIINGTFL